MSSGRRTWRVSSGRPRPRPGGRSPAGGTMPEFSTSIDIEAPPEVVFAHLVTAERMVLWMGQRAELQAIRGGEFAVDINGYLIRGEYVEVDPPHRVVVSWGMAGTDDLPPRPSLGGVIPTPPAARTTPNILHTGLPATRAPKHAAGVVHH